MQGRKITIIYRHYVPSFSEHTELLSPLNALNVILRNFMSDYSLDSIGSNMTLISFVLDKNMV